MPPKKKSKSKVPEPEPDYEEEEPLVINTASVEGDGEDDSVTRCVCGSQGVSGCPRPSLLHGAVRQRAEMGPSNDLLLPLPQMKSSE